MRNWQKTSKYGNLYLRSRELSESNTGSLHLAIEKTERTKLSACNYFHTKPLKLVKASKVNVLQVSLAYLKT